MLTLSLPHGPKPMAATSDDQTRPLLTRVRLVHYDRPKELFPNGYWLEASDSFQAVAVQVRYITGGVDIPPGGFPVPPSVMQFWQGARRHQEREVNVEIADDGRVLWSFTSPDDEHVIVRDQLGDGKWPSMMDIKLYAEFEDGQLKGKGAAGPVERYGINPALVEKVRKAMGAQTVRLDFRGELLAVHVTPLRSPALIEARGVIMPIRVEV